jgi:hypothetical protein
MIRISSFSSSSHLRFELSLVRCFLVSIQLGFMVVRDVVHSSLRIEVGLANPARFGPSGRATRRRPEHLDRTILARTKALNPFLFLIQANVIKHHVIINRQCFIDP